MLALLGVPVAPRFLVFSQELSEKMNGARMEATTLWATLMTSWWMRRPSDQDGLLLKRRLNSPLSYHQ